MEAAIESLTGSNKQKDRELDDLLAIEEVKVGEISEVSAKIDALSSSLGAKITEEDRLRTQLQLVTERLDAVAESYKFQLQRAQELEKIKNEASSTEATYQVEKLRLAAATTALQATSWGADVLSAFAQNDPVALENRRRQAEAEANALRSVHQVLSRVFPIS